MLRLVKRDRDGKWAGLIGMVVGKDVSDAEIPLRSKGSQLHIALLKLKQYQEKSP